MREGNLELRPMSMLDVNRAVELIRRFDDEDAQEAAEEYERGFHNHFVLLDSQKLIGVTGFKVIPNTDRTYGLSWTFVAPEQRQSGAGDRMLKWVMEDITRQGGRKVFVSTSDYRNESGHEVYRELRHMLRAGGFEVELQHRDFYSTDETLIVMGLRLQDRGPAEIVHSLESIRMSDVDEIPESEGAFWLAWETVTPDQASTPQDFQRVFSQVQSWGARSVFVALPSDIPLAQSLLASAGFRSAGSLKDYYDDGVDELHYRRDLA